jgi:hypothetical protein
MYFNLFPQTLYTLDDGKNIKLVRNILLRAVINEDIRNNRALYDEYDVLDGETPEIVADKFYQNPLLHWIILHTNEILDPRFDWPMSYYNLIQYCNSKYANVNATHHYENSDGYVVNSTAPFATAITNLIYEDRLNETKRRIKILRAEFVNAIINDFSTKIKL